MVKFKGDMGTKADKLIHEIADWLAEHITNESYVEINLFVRDKGNTATNTIKGKIEDIENE